MSHDEGACYAPTDIYNASIFLTHWGRTDLEHESNTAFTPDNYTQVGRSQLEAVPYLTHTAAITAMLNPISCFHTTRLLIPHIQSTHARIIFFHIIHTLIPYLHTIHTQEYHHSMQPGGWLRLIKGHPCYTPGKVSGGQGSGRGGEGRLMCAL